MADGTTAAVKRRRTKAAAPPTTLDPIELALKADMTTPFAQLDGS